jgi:hypothetical protein
LWISRARWRLYDEPFGFAFYKEVVLGFKVA